MFKKNHSLNFDNNIINNKISPKIKYNDIKIINKNIYIIYNHKRFPKNINSSFIKLGNIEKCYNNIYSSVKFTKTKLPLKWVVIDGIIYS